MTRTLISETINKIGGAVSVMGWVNTKRDHGKIVFIDLVHHDLCVWAAMGDFLS